MPIALDGLTGIDLDLRLSAARVTVGDCQARAHRRRRQSARRQAHRDDRRVAGLRRRRSRARSALAKSDAGADFKSQLQFTDVDLEQLPRRAVRHPPARRQGQPRASTLEAPATASLALTRTLNGTANADRPQGRHHGLQCRAIAAAAGAPAAVGRAANSAAAARRSRSSPSTLKIAAGHRARSRTSRIEGPRCGSRSAARPRSRRATRPARAPPALVVGGTGDATPAFELPFVVQGPWDDPIMLPDAQSLIRRSGAAAPLLDAVRDRKTATRCARRSSG